MHHPHRLNRLAVAALSLLAAGAGYAQDTEKGEKKKPEQLDTVIVTTNRRAEEAQKVSGVVQSISGEQLRQDGVAELRNLQAVVPGLSISTQEGAVDIYIRGVGTGNNTELGDPGAAPHINGIYLPRPRGMGLMFFDLERVEVNKGPQGTLYGRNALAGSLNIITAKPRLGQTGGYLQADVGNRNSSGSEGALNLGLGSDMAVRAAFQYVKRDMGYKNVSTDPVAASRSPAGLEDNIGLRLSYLWDLSDRTRLQVMADGGHERGTGYPGSNVKPAALQAGMGADALDLRKVHYRGPQGELTNDLWGLQAKLDHDFGNFGAELSSSLRSVDAFQRNASSAGVDFPGFKPIYDDYQSVFWVTNSRSYVNELRLYSIDPQAPLQWTAGVFDFKERLATGFASFTDKGNFYSGSEYTMPNTRVNSSAIFADGSFKLSPGERLLAGLRYSKEDKFRFGIGGNIAVGFGARNPNGTNDYDCCIVNRLGTEGFRPALLDRPNFDMASVKTDAQKALFIMQTTAVPGARDTLLQQLGPIASGTNPNGLCVNRPDINPQGLLCPSNGTGYAWTNMASVPEQQIGSTKASYGDFRLGYEHDLARDNMVYVKVSTGHKGGGFNDSVGGVAATYRPESVTVYEAGSRNVFMLGGRRAVANATVFHYNYKDIVLQSLTCSGYVKDPVTGLEKCAGAALNNENAARAVIQGLELEFKLPLAAGLNVDVNAVLLDAKIKGGTVVDARSIDYSSGLRASTIDLTGNRLPLSSKFAMNARLMQRFALGSGQFDWQVLGSYRSSYYLDQFNDRDIVYVNGKVLTPVQAGLSGRQKGYAQFNLGAGYDWGNGFRLEAWVTNLTDKQASQKRLVGQDFDLRFLNDARSYGLRGRYSF